MKAVDRLPNPSKAGQAAVGKADNLAKKKRATEQTEQALIELELQQAEQAEQLPAQGQMIEAPLEFAQAGGAQSVPGFPVDEPVQTGFTNALRYVGAGLAGGIAFSTSGNGNLSTLPLKQTFTSNTPTAAFERDTALFADVVSINAQTIELSHVSQAYNTNTEAVNNADSVSLQAASIQVVQPTGQEPEGIFADSVSIVANSETTGSNIDVYARAGSITTAANGTAADTVQVGKLAGQAQNVSINLGAGADSVVFIDTDSSEIVLEDSSETAGVVTLVIADGTTLRDTYTLSNIESFSFADQTFASLNDLDNFLMGLSG